MYFFLLRIRRPPRSTQSRSSAASDVYKRQSFTFVIFSASSLERSTPKFSSIATTNSTASRLSKPKSSKLASLFSLLTLHLAALFNTSNILLSTSSTRSIYSLVEVQKYLFIFTNLQAGYKFISFKHFGTDLKDYLKILKENIYLNFCFCYSVSYTHLRAHETGRNLVCRLLLEKKKNQL
eukprot:TRINITY_DN4789_c0_g1_i24.p2 TRINITY_DN4789_c0_g1~~TRINITY_DN4789_c0_g1_i24.p2  ORF type:complete len:180 (+),score=53.94 TRINITY_DN4789_c0_g1_i24:1-540(+)